MPSAGRPITRRVLVDLMARGVVVAPIVLHTGVSSPEKHELPMPEPFDVPAATARLVNVTRESGGRVVAVGTTSVRALESAADPGRPGDGARQGWTDLVLSSDRPARVCTGLISGLHEPEASHLLLLEAVAGPDLVAAAYRAVVVERYLWHEFGDSMLLPCRDGSPAVREVGWLRPVPMKEEGAEGIRVGFRVGPPIHTSSVAAAATQARPHR